MMCEFDHDSLPELLRSVDDSQTRWTTQNWQQSVSQYPTELEELLEMTIVLDTWKIAEIPNKVRDKFIPEVLTDLWVSMHLACWGLYKYAVMCLRSALESALRLIYFSAHPIEFEWWLAGNEWYRERRVAGQEVWGPGYQYFAMLDAVKSFDDDVDERSKLVARVGASYKRLSKYIHSGPEYFQTEVDHLTPRYDVERFNRWLEDAKRVCELMNLLLALGLHDTFSKLGAEDRERIVEKGIRTEGDRDKLRRVVP